MSKFLKVSNYLGFTEYFIPLECTDPTWGEVLDYLESVLDDQYCNTNTIVGCKVPAEIVEMTQDEYEALKLDL